MFKRILVAVDGSPASNAGLKSAISLAADQQAMLMMLHVISDAAIAVAFEGEYIPASYADTFHKTLEENGRKILAKAEALARASAVEFKSLLLEARGSSVAGAILEQARKLKVDVIVLGTHGRRGLQRVLLGSDAETVVREARVPVLLVRKEAQSRARRISATGSATKRNSGRSATALVHPTP